MMEQIIEDLTQMQIDSFFETNRPTTQRDCDNEAARITGGKVQPTTVQGASSYTVIAQGDDSQTTIVQFRQPDSLLPMDMLHLVETSYHGFVPHHRVAEQFQGLPVFTMSDIGGISMYLARQRLQDSNCLLLRETIVDYARFFASAWHSAPQQPRETREALRGKYFAQLDQLRVGLPHRFRSTVETLITRLDDLLAEDWPLVPNHVDLLENNIHVDPQTGHLTGIRDWRDAEIGPFGLSLGGLETMLSIARSEVLWEYHANQAELRQLFWQTLYTSLGSFTRGQKDRVQNARDVGLFLNHGFTYNEAGDRVPAGEGEGELPYLEAVLWPPGGSRDDSPSSSSPIA